MILLIKFIFRLVFDLYQFPVFYLRKLFIIFNSETKIISEQKIIIDNNLIENFQVIIHHFAPRTLNYTKTINGRDFELGLEKVLFFLNSINIPCVLNVTDSKPEYIKGLKQKYKSIRIEDSKINMYDFKTYLDSDLHQPFSTFLNDNIAIDFNMDIFLKTSFSIFRDNKSLGIVGIGSNSQLRISLFKRWFTPHIQTNVFIIKSELMKDFIKINKWFLNSKKLLPYSKHAICRLLEIGLSLHVLKSEKSLCFLQEENNFIYSRYHSTLDFKSDWIGIDGDYRYYTKSNPYKLTKKNEIQIKYYE